MDENEELERGLVHPMRSKDRARRYGFHSRAAMWFLEILRSQRADAARGV